MNDLILTLNDTRFGTFFIFLLGLIVGSFLNVIICRLPEEKSVIRGRSQCPKCHVLIPWYLNIPLLSYLCLKARCRYCKEAISIQYPLIELITGLFFVALFLKFKVGVHFACYAILISLLIVISVIDLYHRIIPDELSLSGLLIGFLVSFLTKDITWIQSLMGVLLGGGVFWSIAAAYEKWSGREGLGGGDIKLLGMLGAWLGYQSILIVVILSSAAGSLIGIGLIAVKGKSFKAAIPFGPFLAIAALAYLFYPSELHDVFFPSFP